MIWLIWVAGYRQSSRGWMGGRGGETKTLVIEALGQVYRTTVFGSQIWCNSAHVIKADTQLKSVMRTIS